MWLYVNATTPGNSTHLTNVTASLPHAFNVTTVWPQNITSNSTYPPPWWFQPMAPDFVTSAPPPFVISTSTYTSGYFISDSFYAYVVLLLVFCLALLVTKLAIRRRTERARQAELRRVAVHQRTEVNTITSVQVGNGSCNITDEPPKDFDLPPAYDEVVQSYIDAKQAQNEAEEGAVGGMTTVESSVTIQTDIDSNNSSVIDLNDVTMANSPKTKTLTHANAQVTCPPPTYDMAAGNNDSVTNMHQPK